MEKKITYIKRIPILEIETHKIQCTFKNQMGLKIRIRRLDLVVCNNKEAMSNKEFHSSRGDQNVENGYLGLTIEHERDDRTNH